VSVRVLVVEDSLTVRKRIVEILSGDPELAVVGEAADGKAAIELCERLRPDVMTVDMVLPVMSGLAVTEYVMAYCPTPILVVSSSLNRGELFRTYDALAAGAVDVLDKPRAGEEGRAWEARLVGAVKLVSHIKPITHPRARLGAMSRLGPPAPRTLAEQSPRRGCQLVAIGGSTGSPAALVEILRGLGGELPVPALLVVHINEPFGAALAEWLDAQGPVRVRYARAGEPLRSARGALLAPPGRHLVVERGCLQLSDAPERHSCRPSVDVLFESLAREPGADRVVACLLTGMGRDGARGMLALRQAGAHTIAQDEATCAVYGMPREAVRLGAVDRVLPLGEIGPALADAAASGAVR
jgi:two-component system chemotaxis response regulator CheB